MMEVRRQSQGRPETIHQLIKNLEKIHRKMILESYLKGWISDHQMDKVGRGQLSLRVSYFQPIFNEQHTFAQEINF